MIQCKLTLSKFGGASAESLSLIHWRQALRSSLFLMNLAVPNPPMEMSMCRKNMAMPDLQKSPGRSINDTCNQISQPPSLDRNHCILPVLYYSGGQYCRHRSQPAKTRGAHLERAGSDQSDFCLWFSRLFDRFLFWWACV